MNRQTPSLGNALVKANPAEPEPEEEEIPNAMATRKRRGKKGMTVYVDPIAHETIKRVAHSRKMTIEELWIEGINLVLRQHNEKAIA